MIKNLADKLDSFYWYKEGLKRALEVAEAKSKNPSSSCITYAIRREIVNADLTLDLKKGN